MPLPSYMQYWGKAHPDVCALHPWHPLAYHSLDVAAVGRAALEADCDLRSRLASLLGLPQEVAAWVLQTLLAIHDLGKFSAAFQAQQPELFALRTGQTDLPQGERHDVAGQALWEAMADELVALTLDCNDVKLVRIWRRRLDPLAMAAFGHHGVPRRPPGSFSLRRQFGRDGLAGARGYLKDMIALLRPEAAGGEWATSTEGIRQASWAVAGFVTVCDWLGSNQSFFPYRAPGPNLAAYWTDHALPQAHAAMAAAGVLPAHASPERSFADLFPGLSRPTRLQDRAASYSIPPGPSLFVIEELTGAGKTEAAVMLAHRLIAAGRANGLFVALPTMATANAMYGRMARAYRRLFAANEEPSLVLSHGARDLHDGFRDSIRPIGSAEEPPYDRLGRGEDETASAACAAWLAEDRRRAFLADVGVGTVDQAILAVLPNRFQSLRLLGLARRVLLLDEVHAYDAYMAREIETLLTFHAALGGNAILLSATLPQTMRRRFLAAFAEGRRQAGAAPVYLCDLQNDYPLLTHVHDGGCVQQPIDAREELARRLPVRLLPDAAAAAADVVAEARAGRAVCWIRNTVADALDAHALLAAEVPEPMLFHARFTMADRLAIEREVRRCFGPESSVAKRYGRVLIATQVAEQSLDLDFDVLVSDLAPIDALIQRAGRLWRHQREGRHGSPELRVVSPHPVDDPGESWYRAAFPKAGSVYRDHGALWLTARTLIDEGAIDLPKRARHLIESVYDADAAEHVPSALRRASEDADGRARGDRSLAHANTLKLGAGYVTDAGDWDSDADVPTRLGEPEVVLRLACWVEGELKPWAAGEPTGYDPWRAWRLSEVRVLRRYVAGAAPQPPDVQAAIEAAVARWPRRDREIAVIPLTSDRGGPTWCGTALKPSGAPVEVTYDNRSGLILRDRDRATS